MIPALWWGWCGQTEGLAWICVAQGVGEGVPLEQKGPRSLVLQGQPWESQEIIFLRDRADLAAGSCWERLGRAGLGAVGCAASRVGREGRG